MNWLKLTDHIKQVTGSASLRGYILLQTIEIIMAFLKCHK